MPSATLHRDTKRQDDITLRAPDSRDGEDVWRLIRDCGPLDDNSLYCNLLQCDHFADTCVLAQMDGATVGWISGYIKPGAPETLFVWQVAVSEKARGMGLAGRMLDHLVARDICADVTGVNTTITSDNDASWALFRSFARRMEAPIEGAPHYRKDVHFGGRHDTENMAVIGPFGALRARKAA